MRTYMQECTRLRAIAEHSIRLSGEIDLKKIQKEARELALEYDHNMRQLHEQVTQLTV